MNKKMKKVSQDAGEKAAEEGKRAGNASEEQKTMLLEFVRSHPQLLTNKFSTTVTKASLQQLWNMITSILNQVPGGAVKTMAQWKRTVADQKRAIKGKLAANNQHLRKTGGGPKEHEELSSEEEQQLTLIVPKIAVAGNTNITESTVAFDVGESGHTDDLGGFENFLESHGDPKFPAVEWGGSEQVDTLIVNDELHPVVVHIPEVGGKINNDDLPSDLEYIDKSIMQTELSVPKKELTLPKTELTLAKTELPLPKTLLTLPKSKSPVLKAEHSAPDAETLPLNPEKSSTGEPDCVPNPFKKMKGEVSAFPSKGRSMAVQRQDASLRNSENMIALSNEELSMKKQYYQQKIFYRAKEVRVKQLRSRILMTMINQLIHHPW